MADNKPANVNVETHLMAGDPRQLVRLRATFICSSFTLATAVDNTYRAHGVL
jgi:hypothetical protein